MINRYSYTPLSNNRKGIILAGGSGTHLYPLPDASNYVRVIEERQGLKSACPEEVTWRMGYINSGQLLQLTEPLKKSSYGHYLEKLLK